MSWNAETIRQKLNGPLALLFGGKSSERQISLKSGNAILEALQRQEIPVTVIDPADANWMEKLADHQNAFIALHGPGGEDGTIQGALECLGVNYTGSGVMASALAMDKLRCKRLWLGEGLSTPHFMELHADSDWQATSDILGQAIVKPACEGSSIGMSRADNAEELRTAWQLAKDYGRVFAEQWVTGAEFTVAILNGEALPAIRLETDASFYDFNAKYISNDTRYHCPSGLSEAKEREIQQLALAAFEAVGCRDWGRVDVMQSESGHFYLLEVNTIPGMTDHSLVPMAAKQAGLDFDQLVLRVLSSSLERSGN
ncbi:D-alanine--D-alanine ligase [Spongiibacter sp. KMU-158]|uniref:D-alanine--D-alanine ligase n=1 Tax=Spongiibacter pelagi TaxID=2760804 RepID=A0A927GX87_9GAMM|nr:D-alanine--D-alanine ligase [Spongiibacter pelagi]MBD2859742.1 D-alanine--D-alanine ligase [Spongiibacter pelagi]